MGEERRMREKGELYDFNTYIHDTVSYETGIKTVTTQRWVQFKFIREKDGKEFNIERLLDFENNKEDLRILFAIEDLLYADLEQEKE